MKQKLETSLSVLLLVGFFAATVGLFLPDAPVLPLFTAFLFICFFFQGLNKGPWAFMMAAFITLIGLFSFSAIDSSQMMALPALILCLWGGCFLLYLHQSRREDIRRKFSELEDEAAKKAKLLRQEIEYYGNRKTDLTERAHKRRMMADAARDLGAVLDPQALQEKLIEWAGVLFPGRPVRLSYGQNPDPIDKYIIQKKQGVVVPGDLFKGQPLMACPVLTQRTVAGILRVGGGDDSVFSRDDLRLLDILASLASLALDNAVLFNQVQESALRDNLTGLLTHKAFQEHLDYAVLEASRYHQPLSVILTDIDHFKNINDTYGHQAGDQVLQGFSHALMRHVRDVDVVSRYGGEEFVILLLQTPHSEAVQIAENIRRDMAQQRFSSGGSVIQVTGSFGVSTFPEEGTSAQQLLRLADQRMYEAKKSGRNQVRGKAA